MGRFVVGDIYIYYIMYMYTNYESDDWIFILPTLDFAKAWLIQDQMVDPCWPQIVMSSATKMLPNDQQPRAYENPRLTLLGFTKQNLKGGAPLVMFVGL